jgi:hypothetical protein
VGVPTLFILSSRALLRLGNDDRCGEQLSATESDAFGSAEYRRELVTVLVRRTLEEAMG